jgi:hypothetical protein
VVSVLVATALGWAIDRLLARYSDKPNAHAVEALDKLGTALHGVMPARTLYWWVA